MSQGTLLPLLSDPRVGGVPLDNRARTRVNMSFSARFYQFAVVELYRDSKTQTVSPKSQFDPRDNQKLGVEVTHSFSLGSSHSTPANSEHCRPA